MIIHVAIIDNGRYYHIYYIKKKKKKEESYLRI